MTASDSGHIKTRNHQESGSKNCNLAVGSKETTSTNLDEVRVPNIPPVSKIPQDLALDKYQVLCNLTFSSIQGQSSRIRQSQTNWKTVELLTSCLLFFQHQTIQAL